MGRSKGRPSGPDARTGKGAVPAWPALEARKPAERLGVERHPESDKIALVRSFFPAALCRRYVDFLRTLPLQTTPGRPRRGEAARVNDRFQVRDEAFARRLWHQTGLKEALLDDEAVRAMWGGEVVGLNPNLRVYRYAKGHYFDCHYDDYNDLTLETEPPTAVRTTWTLLLYLSSAAEGCVGGETVFYPHDGRATAEAVVVAPETGTLLLHKHGKDCLLHEGRRVEAGEKWVLRTDLCVRR